MNNQAETREQMESASSGVFYATTALAAVGCALGTGTLMAMWFGTHALGVQLTGIQAAMGLIAPLMAGLLPVAVVLFGHRTSKKHPSGSLAH